MMSGNVWTPQLSTTNPKKNELLAKVLPLLRRTPLGRLKIAGAHDTHRLPDGVSNTPRLDSGAFGKVPAFIALPGGAGQPRRRSRTVGSHPSHGIRTHQDSILARLFALVILQDDES
jgi:hypothetical protein